MKFPAGPLFSLSCTVSSRRCFRSCLVSAGLVAIVALVSTVLPMRASLVAYDAAINGDASAGLVPTATLTSSLTFNDVNKAPFNFGTNSGDVTIEFVVTGDPVAGGLNGYLAVGTNTSSNLRYEQWSDTGQLGFTQIGVADYLFSPVIPSPTQPVHIAYVWHPASGTMSLYLNGSLAGARPGVSASFAMPYGQGWLGNSGAGTEGMVGTIHRVTVYDAVLPEATIQRHADAYNDVVRPPILVSFSATPATLFVPASATLNWNVQNAVAVFINGTDVTSQQSLPVSPVTTTAYTLVATNAGGSVTGSVTVVVNPGPEINSFTVSKAFAGAGETVTLSWNVRYANQFSISPGVGDVTAQTLDGMGSVEVLFAATTTYTLTTSSGFGTDTTNVLITLVHPATHLVISEIMADNESTLADEDGAFSDWIEIYNPTAASINLAGYFLTDDQSNPTNWAFPEFDLPAGAHRIVFASGKNRANAAAPLHANFQLDKAGEYLALIGPGLTVVHAFDPFPSLGGDISFGLLGGDVNFQRSMGIPTPGTANNDTPAPPASVHFSHASGTFAASFNLALTSDTPGAEIRYTLNDSAPGVTNGTFYTGPIPIDGTRRIRAAAVAFGQASEVASASFIKLAPDLAAYTSSLPIVVIENFGAGIIPQKGWSGNGSGIRQIPRQSAVWATFDRAAGTSSLTNPPQMLSRIGIRGRGAFSSQWRQKPYSVEALNARDGELDVSPLGLPAHPDWVLYFPDPDSNKDPSLLFNTFAYELSKNSGHYSVRFRWVEAFVNEDGGDLQLADRRGVYAIIEKVSRGADRLDFQRLSEDGTNGGWLLSLNRMDPEPETGWPAPNGTTQPQFFHTAGPNRLLQSPPNGQVVGDDEPQQSNGYLNFDNPSGYIINPNQRAAIENWFKQFEDVLWNNAIWRDPVNGYRKYLDARDFADYFILNVLTHNGDGLLISMFPWKGDDGKLRMGPAWDYNWSAYFISGLPTGSLLWRSEQLWYERLFTDPDFLQLYIDRWWDHRRGAMSNAGMDAIIDGQAADISPAKAVLNGIPNAADWNSRLAQMKTWLKDRANWIDGNYLRPPIFNQDGGEVPDAFQVTILGTNGTIYFTTDGSDPRAPGGAVAASAQAFQLPFTLTAQTMVQARVRNGANWSGLSTAVFFPPQDLTKLALTEIMYHPPAFGSLDGDEVEFLEFKNTGAVTLNLGTLTFAFGINFTFTNGTRLEPGQFFVLARNAVAFQAKYPGVAVNGLFSGKLDNSGETLRLVTLFGSPVLSVTYNDRAPWPLAPDSHGFSLVPKNAVALPNSDSGADWRASSALGGSPGADDPEPAVPPIVINEVLTHTDPPEVDWIELFNPSASDVSIGGWFLSDDGAAPRKFRIPDAMVISAGGYRVFTEADFNATPGSVFSFSLDSAGDSIYLSSGGANTNLTGYSHGFAVGAAANGTSFGRYLISTGEEQFPAQVSTTSNGPNAGPIIGPVVIQEISYHPDAGGDEFIELRNITGIARPLFDLARPTNTWRVDGLGFTFPTNVWLPADGVLLIVATNPAAFRSKYGIAAGVQILGPFAGGLQDSGERLELQRPEVPDTNGLAYITVDEVRYNDKAPWPAAADGSGPSLQRRSPSAYGNDPINWEAALPTPGANFVAGQLPVITSQPQSQSILSFQDAQFSVTASGGLPLFYQWLFNGDLIAGATNSFFSLTNVQPWQAGDYSAVVFNHHGSAASVAARLTVNRVPTILGNPTNQFVRPGLSAVFRVSAVGNGPLRYQWRFNGAAITDATNAILTITNAQLSSTGAYTVVVIDNVGPIVSAPAELILLIDPLVVQPPLSQVVVTGATVTLSVTVTNTATLPIEYRWRANGQYFATNSLPSRTAFLTIPNARPPLNSYAVVLVNPSRPSGLLSAAAVLTFTIDTDGDGLPDPWEAAYGFGTNNIADATLDADGDGMSNRSEYMAGTDPTNGLSYLKIDSISVNGRATLLFGAISNRTYTIQHRELAGDGAWLKLADVAAQGFNRTETILDLEYTTNRFYRLATPQQP
jgi:hypothetical protein